MFSCGTSPHWRSQEDPFHIGQAAVYSVCTPFCASGWATWNKLTRHIENKRKVTNPLIKKVEKQLQKGDKPLTINVDERHMFFCDLPLFLGNMLHIYATFVRMKNR
jgi:hypothetical protein